MYSRKYKGKESPFFNKAQRVILGSNDNSGVASDLIKMNESWENNPIPLYIYINATNDYGYFDESPFLTKKTHLNNAIRGLADNVRSNLFYEKLLGYLLKGHQEYSHKEFRNLKELNESITDKDLSLIGKTISKAIMLSPGFELYLNKVSETLNPALNEIIETSKNNELTLYTKFFAVKNCDVWVDNKKGSVLKEFSAKNMSAEEKVLFALSKGIYSEDKLNTKKSIEVGNNVLLNLMKFRPDIALNLVDPMVFLNSSKLEVKDAFIDLFSKESALEVTKFLGFFSQSTFSYNIKPENMIRRTILAFKKPEDVADLLLTVKEVNPKVLPEFIKLVKDSHVSKNWLDAISENIAEKSGEVNIAFIEIYRNTNFLKNKLKNVKNVPNHLKVEAFFNPTLSKKDLLNDNVDKVKVSDISKEMASSFEFWVTYIEKLKKNVAFSPEISKKMKNVSDNKEVVDALLASTEPVAAVYLLTLDTSVISQKEINDNFINKTKINPRTVLFTPLNKIHLVPEEATIESVSAFRGLMQNENAFFVMSSSTLFKKQSKDLEAAMIDNFVTMNEKSIKAKRSI